MSRSVNIPNLGATRARPLGRGSLLRATEVAGSRLQGSRAPEGARSSSHMQMDMNAQGAPKGVRTAVSGAPKFGQKKCKKRGAGGRQLFHGVPLFVRVRGLTAPP